MGDLGKYKSKKTLMINDGNISLPVYDYIHYKNIFDKVDRYKRVELL